MTPTITHSTSTKAPTYNSLDAFYYLLDPFKFDLINSGIMNSVVRSFLVTMDYLNELFYFRFKEIIRLMK